MFVFLRFYNFIKGILCIYEVFFKKLRSLLLLLYRSLLLTELIQLCLNKLTSKYGKRIVLFFFIYFCVKLKKRQSSFSHSFIAEFPFCFVSNTTNFGCPFRPLHMQIYILNACKLGWEENLFDFCVEWIAFRKRILQLNNQR